MTHADRFKLLFGPYNSPPLRKGDRAFCQALDCDVVITGWTDARISWPRCRAKRSHGGGSGLLVDEELPRAVRNESSVAIQFWWGVNYSVVTRWRKALDVGRVDPEGSRRLIQAAAERGADKTRGKKLTAEQVKQRRRTAKKLNLAQYLTPGFHGPRWIQKQLALLGKEPDSVVGRKIGRSLNAVRIKRTVLGIPNPFDQRRKKR